MSQIISCDSGRQVDLTSLKDGDIVLIDKKVGMTSFDVIRVLRRLCGVKKMGHAGTLDPLASGLMIVAIGSATKKISDYIKLDKTYSVEVTLGFSTTTGDLEGEIVEKKDIGTFSAEEVPLVLSEMEDDLDLPVPVYSAVKVKGKALYKRAREGYEVTAPIRNMHVESLRLIEMEPKGRTVLIRVEMDVASGVYVRSVATEMGKRLGYPAMVSKLRRTRIGQWSVDHACLLDGYGKT